MALAFDELHVESEGAEPLFEAVGLAVPLEGPAGVAAHVIVDVVPVDVGVCAGPFEGFDELVGLPAVNVPSLVVVQVISDRVMAVVAVVAAIVIVPAIAEVAVAGAGPMRLAGVIGE